MSIHSKKLTSAVFAALFASALISPVQAASITYSINNTYSGSAGGALVGTLTTDGTIGTLTTANITGFTLNASVGTAAPASFLFASSQANVNGTALSADATNLYFDFTPVGVNGVVNYQFFGINSGAFGVLSGPNGLPIPSTYREWTLLNFDVTTNTNQAGVDRLQVPTPSGQTNTFASNFYSSKVSIGASSAVPVPSSLLLFGTGLLALGVRRARSKMSRA
jgi:PEP-CTERM motif